ncbi:uncharacterized protein LOC125433975 [Sphaerodactylus townsendi]|uniref:uncharacterized protein LOC125433975 n=1 Tax=Sphaerodactylus townsendi TaxID=933632 RepID=UPI0020271821|nr:uncharacterized protein LOC125433975 [Sphaerodactylus townsendi]
MATRNNTKKGIQDLKDIKTPDKNGEDMNSKLEKMTEMMAMMHEDTKETITRFREETKDGFDKLGNRLDKMEMELTEVKKDLSQLKKVEENIIEMKHEIKLANNNIATLDVRTGIVKNGIEEVKNQMALLELKMKENVLRLRGCEESENENTRKMVVDAIAELLSLGKEEVWEAIDKVYRINSRTARIRKLPRDINVTFTKKIYRDEILQAHAKQRLLINQKQVIVLKEIPLYIRKKRKGYQPLVSWLTENKITYRWLQLEGLTFLQNQKRITVDSLEGMDNFLDHHRKKMIERT